MANTTNALSAAFSSLSITPQTETPEAPQSVAVAASPPLQLLRDQSGRVSPKLSDRGIEQVDLTIAQAVQEGKLTNSLRFWLKCQNPKWKVSDLKELEESEDEFWETLYEQAAYYRNHTVIDLLPKNEVIAIRLALTKQMEKMEALLTLLNTSEEELDEAPENIGNLPFLSRQAREENRKAYFDSFDHKLTEELKSWLVARGWSSEDIQDLAELDDAEEFMQKLTSIAMDRDDYVVIQSIPEEYIEIAIEEVESSRNANYELLQA
jgi:hypothetical protein